MCGGVLDSILLNYFISISADLQEKPPSKLPRNNMLIKMNK